MRQLKTQGSSKINQHCTASLTVVHSKDGLKVDICQQHYGHEQSLGYIRLSQSAHQYIAAQLSKGVSFDRILDDVRDSVGLSLQRIHLLTKKDIQNIERAHNIKGIQRHADDALSVSAWVEELTNENEGNPVILYKAQGQTLQCSNLNKEDFILALQTPLQKHMLQKCGKNIVCMDSTHGTNAYDFKLISLLVVDDFGEGFPVAWCLCNREDKHALVNFLNKVKENTGLVTPAYFMSDDAEQFFTAWTEVFGLCPNKLLCTWHVDRAWRGKLSIIGNKELEATVYHSLRVLLEETDISTFEKIQEETLEQLLKCPMTEKFGKYYEKNYKERKNQWAACYRKGCTANTNMYVESFHRVIKHIYLK